MMKKAPAIGPGAGVSSLLSPCAVQADFLVTSPSTPQSPPLGDSPLFWLLLFGGAALVALALIEPKFAKREARLERMFHARQQAAQRAQQGGAGQGSGGADAPAREGAEPDDVQAPLVSLRSLSLVLAVLLIAGAFALAIFRRRMLSEPGT